MNYVYDDGGRAQAGYKGQAGDCTVRAIAIATELPYQEVYDELSHRVKNGPQRKGRLPKASARNGVPMSVTRKYMESLRWEWTPTMQIGSGCQVHLRADELPAGRLVVRVTKHLAAVVDGVIHDTHDPSRDGTRCVYGYFRRS
jgi:hypothetical protein